MADHRDPAGGAGLRRGLAVPCFADDPADLVQLGVGAERAGLDGYFLWDHLVHSDSGQGPPIVDPWQVLAVVAARTSRIKLGTMITPVARRRPWKLAKEVTTLDLLSGGRVILGVGLGDPAHAEFGLFGESADRRVRAELLDEGLDVLAGLWTGQPFSHEGKHFTVGPVRFSPSPLQQPRVPIWVGGVIPAGGPLARAARWVAGTHPRSGPVTRAARWHGFVPIHPGRRGDRATVGEIAAGQIRCLNPGAPDIRTSGVHRGAISCGQPPASGWMSCSAASRRILAEGVISGLGGCTIAPMRPSRWHYRRGYAFRLLPARLTTDG